MNESIYNRIIKEVCDYFGVRRYDVLMKRDNSKSIYNRARSIAIFLIREVTGDAFKAINIFFQYQHSTGAQAAHWHVVVMSRKHFEYKKDVYRLMARVIGKINLAA